MASDEQLILALGFAAICDIEIRKAKERKIWQRKWLHQRIQLGCYENLMKELALERRCVSTLLSSIWNSDVLGFAILALESEAWLRERRTNSSAGGVGYGGADSKTGTNLAFHHYHRLGLEIQVPDSKNEWKMVAEEFWVKWNFPLCLGAMDGKHIRIKPPSHLGTQHTGTTRGFSASYCWPM
ncbi:hypothetical protein TNCV_2632291 [Trichonephila clavipes]|nr:hypothetical protein TNCV_2632291 [Trichonephila clavipes]